MISIQVKLFGRTILDFFQQFPFGVEKNESFLQEERQTIPAVETIPASRLRGVGRGRNKGSVKSKCAHVLPCTDPTKRTYFRKLTLEQKEHLKWTVFNRPDIKDKEIASAFDIHQSIPSNIRKGRLYKALDAVKGGPYAR